MILRYNLQFFAKDGPGGEKTEEPTSKKLEDARTSMWLSEYLDSPQAQEQRRRYREMMEREEPESGQEEMER